MARTAIPETGLPAVSATRPSTIAGVFAAIRSDDAVGFGADAQEAAAITNPPRTMVPTRLLMLASRLQYVLIAQWRKPMKFTVSK
jgi:hypothetical protein